MKQNRTLQKTRKALFALLSEKDFDSIKITDLVAVCGYSRQNFYKNFDNLTELVHKIFLYDLCKALSKRMVFDFKSSLADILRVIQKNSVFYLAVLHSKKGEDFYYLLFDYVAGAFDEFSRYSSFRPLNEDEKQQVDFFAGGMLAYALAFLSKAGQQSAEEAVEVIMSAMPEKIKPLANIDELTSDFLIYKAQKLAQSRFVRL
ncbi:MAG: TetR/AcrR family transcriptional regulator C-terminal domain-containing protein [Acutalibacteraceae bacterium]